MRESADVVHKIGISVTDKIYNKQQALCWRYRSLLPHQLQLFRNCSTE